MQQNLGSPFFKRKKKLKLEYKTPHNPSTQPWNRTTPQIYFMSSKYSFTLFSAYTSAWLFLTGKFQKIHETKQKHRFQSSIDSFKFRIPTCKLQLMRAVDSITIWKQNQLKKSNISQNNIAFKHHSPYYSKEKKTI